MTTDFSDLKGKLDTPVWEPLDFIYTALNTPVNGGAGSSIASDIRASAYNHPKLWYLNSNTNFFQYNCKTNEHIQLASPALAGTFGAGAGCVFLPSQGPRGTIAGSATTTQVTLSTALPASVSANQLVGRRLRIVDNAGGASGKTVERTIISNSSGTTPIITVDSAFGFTPTSGSAYEFLTGRVYLLSSGLLASGSFKYYDVATNSYSGNLSITNLPATLTTDSSFVTLDELHTPISGANAINIGGEVGGYFGTITATASSGTSITGSVATLDYNVLANEYRNFQIRIVEDATTPTAVGQRRRITSHTAGASPVYTVSAWSVTPSSSAKFVIENNNDVLLWTTAGTATYRYDPVGDSWDTTTYDARPSAMGEGCVSFHPFSGVIDSDKNFRYSYIYSFRGGNTSTLDGFDISGASTGVWFSNIPYDGKGLYLSGASSGIAYDSAMNRAIISGTQLENVQCPMYLFDPSKTSLIPYKRVPQIASTVVVGNRVGVNLYVDGTDKKAFAYMIPSNIPYPYRSLLFASGV